VHLVYYNPHYAEGPASPADLVKEHYASHDWCVAAHRAGVSRVSVVQRFREDAALAIDGISYTFVADGEPGAGPVLVPPRKALHAIAQLQPDVVHWNGRPSHVRALRQILPKSSAIVWQHHGGGFPRWFLRPAYRDAFTAVDVLFFTSRRQAHQWRELRIFGTAQCAMEILEASAKIEPRSQRTSRKELGVDGDPLILWVGHLDRNKDPLTVIRGFAEFLQRAPGARLAMIYSTAPLQSAVLKSLASLKLQETVRLVGRRPHEEMAAWYSAADFFTLGSRSEGSGFALLEAIACGCFPIVPDIPAYRQITGHGTVGILWKERSPGGCAAALSEGFAKAKDRQAVRSFFKARLSYRVLGENAKKAYELAYDARNGRS
jgi:glycosyltransferase involved in cell wall biosynthesis